MIYFDDSLPKFVSLLSSEIGSDAVEAGLFSRDTTGRLAFFSATKLNTKIAVRISKLICKELGVYARDDRPFADISDFGVADLFLEEALTLKFGKLTLKFLDRRLVGADWLRPPIAQKVTPPRFVFASLKGGVGRTTALSIVAADLAAQGKNTLIIDLDLEAPGIGSMLLDKGTTPEFGMIDALVEIGLDTLTDAFMADLVGPSALADRHGKIDVIPAFGRRSLANPGEILGKISRAYAERVDHDGNVSTFLDKVSEITDYFSGLERYDAILVDARAGLHETTASALLGLGAHLFLFGLDEPQTFHGYEALLSNITRIRAIAESKSEWISTVSMVQGKAPDNEDARASFATKCESLFRKCGLVSDGVKMDNVLLPAEPFRDVPWEDDSQIADEDLEKPGRPQEILHVLYDSDFLLFDPNHRSQLMTSSVYKQPYEKLINKVKAVMSSHAEAIREQ
jgi:cellulose biosynthesis protein BcsQ